MSITFIDSIKLSIEKWLDNWVNEEILNDGKYLSPLTTITKQIRIAKLDNKNNDVIDQYGYLVFPKGVYNFSGNSENGLHSSQVEFVIAAKVK